MSGSSKKQFLLNKSQIEILYSALETYGNADYKPEAKTLLSMAENEYTSIDQIYDDYYSLELSNDEIDLLLRVYSRDYFENQYYIATLTIKNNLHRGKLSRNNEWLFKSPDLNGLWTIEIISVH